MYTTMVETGTIAGELSVGGSGYEPAQSDICYPERGGIEHFLGSESGELFEPEVQTTHNPHVPPATPHEKSVPYKPGRFVANETNRLLWLADAARKTPIDSVHYDPEQTIALKQQYGINDLETLADKAYPRLSPQQDSAVTLAYARGYEPARQAHNSFWRKKYEKTEQVHQKLGRITPHTHDHGENACDHDHAAQDALASISDRIAAKMPNLLTRKLAETAMRSMMLVWMYSPFGCPGDDIWPPLLKMAQVSTSHSFEDQHADPDAILPPRAKLIKVAHPEPLSGAPPEPMPPGVIPSAKPSLWQRAKSRMSVYKEWHIKGVNDKDPEEPLHATVLSERIRRSAQAVVLGTVACAGIVGGVFNSSAPEGPHDRAKAPVEYSMDQPHYHAIPSPTDPRPYAESLYETKQVLPGESQWKLSQQQLQRATMDASDDRLIQLTTQLDAAANNKTNPDPNRIYPGQSIRVLGVTALHRLERVMQDPSHLSDGIKTYIHTLQSRPNTPAGSKALSHIEHYLRTAFL